MRWRLARATCGEYPIDGPVLHDLAKSHDGNPVAHLADDREVGRLLAAKHLGLAEVPVIVLDHLSEAQRRALVIAGRPTPGSA